MGQVSQNRRCLGLSGKKPRVCPLGHGRNGTGIFGITEIRFPIGNDLPFPGIRYIIKN